MFRLATNVICWVATLQQLIVERKGEEIEGEGEKGGGAFRVGNVVYREKSESWRMRIGANLG